ncbi:RxLR-like protein [Plasmopara halstedii]|uniref:RxLR-like protein n=1 Tax=Plasmopara halstedii TaxID=4781 RepID=A0A0P1B0X6_PLAHL|nr:RxLR-like protein [Plasmopara halstedii]CEG48333.1 RxLR-like protein [Plasmopara halstedii]|eukprot:XP_024584702.1 RxLR-like protein [Plasmopara halstedii]
MRLHSVLLSTAVVAMVMTTGDGLSTSLDSLTTSPLKKSSSGTDIDKDKRRHLSVHIEGTQGIKDSTEVEERSLFGKKKHKKHGHKHEEEEEPASGSGSARESDSSDDQRRNRDSWDSDDSSDDRRRIRNRDSWDSVDSSDEPKPKDRDNWSWRV